MRILYATQATGNGHMIRAKALLPHLRELVDVDVMVSGHQNTIKRPFHTVYKLRGASYVLGRKGNVDIGKTLTNFRPARLISDIFNIPVEKYDLIINDFEPISAWAAKIKNIPCIGLSHQAAYLSSATPRPNKQSKLGEFIFRNYAPVNSHIGFHFRKYDDHIETPIIRKELFQLDKVKEHNHVVTYLPSYNDEILIKYFQKLPEICFKIFSKFTKHRYTAKNCEIYPVGSENWTSDFAQSAGVIIGAGFEGPSEALFLGKRLMVIPMKNQYEQHCNAQALHELGVKVINKVDDNFISKIDVWLNSKAVQIPFADNAGAISERIISAHTLGQRYQLSY